MSRDSSPTRHSNDESSRVDSRRDSRRSRSLHFARVCTLALHTQPPLHTRNQLFQRAQEMDREQVSDSWSWCRPTHVVLREIGRRGQRRKGQRRSERELRTEKERAPAAAAARTCMLGSKMKWLSSRNIKSIIISTASKKVIVSCTERGAGRGGDERERQEEPHTHAPRASPQAEPTRKKQSSVAVACAR